MYLSGDFAIVVFDTAAMTELECVTVDQVCDVI